MRNMEHAPSLTATLAGVTPERGNRRAMLSPISGDWNGTLVPRAMTCEEHLRRRRISRALLGTLVAFLFHGEGADPHSHRSGASREFPRRPARTRLRARPRSRRRRNPRMSSTLLSFKAAFSDLLDVTAGEDTTPTHMPLQQLSYFVSAAQHQSVARAAATPHLAPPGVSRHAAYRHNV